MRILSLFLFLALTLFAEKIERYGVTIELFDDTHVEVVEKILYDFGNTQRHGIYRDIPMNAKFGLYPTSIGLKYRAIYQDGQNAQVSYSEEYGDAGKLSRARIGSPTQYVTGKHIYEIHYSVEKTLFAQEEGVDALIWNAIGTGWNVSIDSVRVNVKLPLSLQSEAAIKNIVSYQGSYGSKNVGGRYFRESGELIFETSDLRAHEGFTIEIAYDNSRFASSAEQSFYEKMTDMLLMSWHWLVMFGFLLYGYAKWNSIGRDPEIGSIAPKYDAPKDIDVLQAGLLLDQFAETEDMGAAIVELAKDGYIEIEQEKYGLEDVPIVGSLFKGVSRIKLKKTKKDGSALQPHQKILLDEVLFPHDDVFDVRSKDQEQHSRVRKGFEEINKSLYEWSYLKEYMRENPDKARKSFLLRYVLFAIPFIFLGGYQTREMVGDEIVMPGIFLMVFLFTSLLTIKRRGNIITMVMSVVVPMMILFPILAHFSGGWSLLLYPFPLILIVLIPGYLFYKIMGAATPKGAQTCRDILGLQEYMKRVKEDQIKRKLEEDPLHLEKLMPYAVLFDIAPKWSGYFKTLSVAAPIWYHGDIDSFSSFSSSISSMGVTSSGGSSGGGGGSVGGGGGGGGGGSW